MIARLVTPSAVTIPNPSPGSKRGYQHFLSFHRGPPLLEPPRHIVEEHLVQSEQTPRQNGGNLHGQLAPGVARQQKSVPARQAPASNSVARCLSGFKPGSTSARISGEISNSAERAPSRTSRMMASVLPDDLAEHRSCNSFGTPGQQATQHQPAAGLRGIEGGNDRR